MLRRGIPALFLAVLLFPCTTELCYSGSRLTLHTFLEEENLIVVSGSLKCDPREVELVEGTVSFGDGREQKLGFMDFLKSGHGISFKVSHQYEKVGSYSVDVDLSLTEIPLFLPGRVLVAIENVESSRKRMEELAKERGLRRVESFDIEELGLKVLEFETDKDPPGEAERLKKEPLVILAQPNFVLRTRSEPGSPLQRLNRELRLETLHKSVVGNGIFVAIIDTGVDGTHKDLNGRVTLSKNLLPDNPFKPEIHGTAVAGIIGASLNQFGIAGVAPEVNLLTYRACSQIKEDKPEGVCFSTAVAKALAHALSHGAQIINMSFGIGAFDGLIDQILARGAQKGVFLVAPVGNRPWQKKMSFPASHPMVIAVGGLNDLQAPYPNAEVVIGTQVLAPATSIFTTTPGNRHHFISGTSMASAVVAGLLAAALERDDQINLQSLPLFDGRFCSWESKLLNLELCEEGGGLL